MARIVGAVEDFISERAFRDGSTAIREIGVP
jgi:hypothetical protein